MTLPKNRARVVIEKQSTRAPLLLIDGIFVESTGNETIRVFNPANNSVIGRVASGNEGDIERAVLSCKTAFHKHWKNEAPTRRAQILLNLATRVEQEGNDLAILESLQTGKTYRESLTYDIANAVRVLRYYAGWVDKYAGDALRLGPTATGLIYHEPFDVVGALLSWNAPFLSATWKVAAAIAVGTTIVLKPSELSPLTTLRLGELLLESGAPVGVVNVVTGRGEKTGQALARSPHLQTILFSGSIENARHVLVSAARSNLKKVQLTTGGKSANIIFEDADVDTACTAAWKAIFNARGEVCSAGSRLIVHDSHYDHVVNIVTKRARELNLGDPLDEHTEMGPVISEDHLKRTLKYISHARQEGARLVAGGGRDVVGLRAQGNYVEPTVFMNVTPNMRLAQEEIPGPVLSIMRFRTEDEALEIANGTEYGMASAIWTQNISRAQRAIRKLASGVVWVNGYGVFDPSIPFGGSKLSGHGRDLGKEGLSQFCYSKSVYILGE
jgi:aldehyde dehydrogenase (NAD+)